LNDARRDRLVDAEDGLPALLWVVLPLGGVIVVGFTYLFGLDNTLVHTHLWWGVGGGDRPVAVHRRCPRLPVRA
jgi:hypothetical protein